MARGDLEVNITANDRASDVVKDVADAVDDLQNEEAVVEVNADDQASDEIADIRQQLLRLDDDEAEVLLKVEKARARVDLRTFQRELIDLDDEQAEVEVKADIDVAKRRLASIDSELDQIDGRKAEATVEVDDEGVSGLTDMLGDMPGLAGEAGAALTGAGGPVAGIAAMAGAMFTLGEHQSNAAIQAKTFADLTGISVENASRLITVSQQAGIEVNDLADMALQLRDGLADSPEYAEKLGINLADGATPGQRLVEVFDKMNTSQLSANEKAEIFGRLLGEEGVRQGQQLVTMVGNIGQAMEDVPDAAVFDEDDVANSREYKDAMNELRLSVLELAGAVDGPLLSSLTESLDSLNEFGEAADSIFSALGAENADSLNMIAESGTRASLALATLGNSEFVRMFNDQRDAASVAGDAIATFANELRQATPALEDSTFGLTQMADATDDAVDSTEDAEQAARDAAAAEADRRQEVADLVAQIDELTAANGRLVGSELDVENAQIRARQSAADLELALAGVDAQGNEVILTEDERKLAINRSTQAQIDAATSAADYEIAQREANGETVSAQEQNAVLAQEYRNVAATLAPGSPLRSRLLGYADELDAIPDTVDTALNATTDFDAVKAYADMIAGVPNLKTTTLRTIRENISRDQRFDENRFGSHVGSRFGAGQSKFVVPGQVFTPDVPGRLSSVEESQRMTQGGQAGAGYSGTPLHIHLADGREVRAMVDEANADILRSLEGGMR